MLNVLFEEGERKEGGRRNTPLSSTAAHLDACTTPL